MEERSESTFFFSAGCLPDVKVTVRLRKFFFFSIKEVKGLKE